MEDIHSDAVGSSTNNLPSQPSQSTLNIHKSLPLDPPRSPSPPPQPMSKMQRHKSVSRRMLSRVREGISNRSKASRSIRPVESETGLARTISGKRKTSSDAHHDKRGGSLDFGRRYLAHEYDTKGLEGAPVDTSLSQRSCTVTTNSTSELWDRSLSSLGLESELPSSSAGLSASVSCDGTANGVAAAEDPSAMSPGRTPRPIDKTNTFAASNAASSKQLHMPYIDLRCFADTDSLDVGMKGEDWVLAEATVRLRSVDGNGTHALKTADSGDRSIDAVLVLDVINLSPQSLRAVCESAIALVGTLADDLDRVAVAILDGGCYETGTEDSTTDESGLMVELSSPDVNGVRRLLDDVTLARKRSDWADADLEARLKAMVDELDSQNIRPKAAHAFFLGDVSSQAARHLRHLVPWPVNEIIIRPSGTLAGQSPSPASTWQILANPLASSDLTLRSKMHDMVTSIRSAVVAGSISTLKLGIKTNAGSRILEVLGDKTFKDLRPGQSTCLCIKLSVPALESSRLAPPPDANVNDQGRQDSLFMELESLIGTLETDILQVEARYKQSLLPANHTITIRKNCVLKRPDVSSRWSVPSLLEGSGNDVEQRRAEVYEKLAAHVAANHAPGEASRYFDKYTRGCRGSGNHTLERIRSALIEESQWCERQQEGSSVTESSNDQRESTSGSAPLLTVTDLSFPSGSSSSITNTLQAERVTDNEDNFSTAPCMPLGDAGKARLATSRDASYNLPTSSVPGVAPAKSLTPNSFAPLPATTTSDDIKSDITKIPVATGFTSETTNATPTITANEHESSDTTDSARQIWHHMRRTSQPISEQLLNLSLEISKLNNASSRFTARPTESSAPLDGDEEGVVGPLAGGRSERLRREALRNKRSVGVETLRGWKWEEDRSTLR